MYARVNYPISLSRGAYWIARSFEAMKEPERAAEWYARSARHPTTYYGQLSLARVDRSAVLRLPADPKPDADLVRQFENHEMTRAFRMLAAAGIESRAEGLRRLIQAAGGVFVPDAQMAAEMARYRASLHEVGNGVAQIAKQMTRANRMGQGAVGGTSAEFTELRLAQMRGLARFILDSADEIDLLLRRRRDAMQLQATAALREFAHAAE